MTSNLLTLVLVGAIAIAGVSAGIFDPDVNRDFCKVVVAKGA
jgi:hypothetical protein